MLEQSARMEYHDDVPNVSRDWDRRLDEAIEQAAAEARAQGSPELDKMLTEMRLYMGAWKDIAQSRLRDLGVYALSRTEHEHVVRMVANAVALETVQEAKRQVDARHDAWWQSTSVKVAVVVGIGSLVASMVLGVINLILNSRHP